MATGIDLSINRFLGGTHKCRLFLSQTDFVLQRYSAPVLTMQGANSDDSGRFQSSCVEFNSSVSSGGDRSRYFLRQAILRTLFINIILQTIEHLSDILSLGQ